MVAGATWSDLVHLQEALLESYIKDVICVPKTSTQRSSSYYLRKYCETLLLASYLASL